VTFKGRGLIQVTGKDIMSQSAYGQISGAGMSVNPIVGLSASQITSLKSIQSLNTNNDWLSLDGRNISPQVKKYEVFESPEDVLALSVTWKRLRDEDRNIAGKLLDSELFAHVKQEDRDKANVIRDYYSKKVMMWKLKGDGKLTSYRNDMNNFVHSNGLVVKENMFGLIYYLPIFYEYDLQLDNVRTLVNPNQEFKKLDKENKPRALVGLTETLIPLSKILKKNSKNTTTEYWFKDTRMDAAVLIKVPKGNSLEHLWEYMFDNSTELKIKGRYIRRSFDDFEYYSVDNWELDRG
jgi:hypothetical protein